MEEMYDPGIDPRQGLSEDQVRQRQEQGPINQVTNSGERTEKQIILANCLTFFNLVFIVLAVFLLLVGSSISNYSFLAIVMINTVIGCFQEIRAKRALDKLTLVAASQVRVIRCGQIRKMHSGELVLDDIVEFDPGDQVCADGILRAGELQVNEALVTGESDPVKKLPGDTLLSGSYVLSGRGRVQLTQVGDDAFAAQLAAEAKADPKATKSEMMRSLDRLIKVVGFALIPLGILLFRQEFSVLQQGLKGSVEATVAALVGMIPEGLYLLTSIAMASSAMKLTRQRVLVQDMNCIETLARVDVLCVDKTGTITEPGMEVENILPLSKESPEFLEQVLNALYGSREPDNDTARALAEFFHQNSNWKCMQYFPFSSETKWSGGVFEKHGAFLAGAPEYILGSAYDQWQEMVEEWACAGYRVLLVARYNGTPAPKALEPDRVEPLALVLLSGKLRPKAAETFAYFAQQGVTVKVISGDNPATAAEVARRAGIPNAEKYIDATTLATDKEILSAAEEYTVFGRVTPEQKKRLVQALKKRKHTVAMTGDGVNDVLAMKEAHCGIAMASGAQAASQVAQLVLLDSDFSAMPQIVGEGRRVINNIQRSATLFLVKNIFSLGLTMISMFTNWPYPLAPSHLTILSALTIGIPAFFLAMEPNYERVRGHFLRGVLRRAFPGGLTNIFVVLMAQAFMVTFQIPLPQIQTVSTAILSMVGMLVLFQVCKPFGWFRRVIWGSMAVALVVSFTFLGSLFDLQSSTDATLLLMANLLIMTPTVFFAIQRVFDWGDRLCAWVSGKFRRKK